MNHFGPFALFPGMLSKAALPAALCAVLTDWAWLFAVPDSVLCITPFVYGLISLVHSPWSILCTLLDVDGYLGSCPRHVGMVTP